LAASVLLAAQGWAVTVLERAAAAGGKMRTVDIGGTAVDAGPTVFTMRWVFEELFEAAGSSLSAHLRLSPAGTLARHAWSADARLDLFADIDRSADAIGDFAGALEARGYRAFCAEARRTYQTLEQPFIRTARPTPLSLVSGAGLRGLPDIWRVNPFETMGHRLRTHFRDPRLRQLFGRYATYCGSSPFRAPATLMLVAHVEQDGVWLVQGGMYALALALTNLARNQGAEFRFNTNVAEIVVQRGAAAGVALDSGELIEADAVIVNADAAALAAGLFGPAAAGAVTAMPTGGRSLSAMTWAMVARTEGFYLLHHNVFFSNDYVAEFDDILVRRTVPSQPTIYVCAQDRDDAGLPSPGDERLLCLVNAPADGDTRTMTAEEIDRCAQRTFGRLEEHGLNVTWRPESTIVTTPGDFERLFPATGGALYGQAVHGSMASFRRPGARSNLPKLYLAGGSTHPGAGVPMAALSGRLAAASVLQDFVSTAPSRRVAMRGGMSMRSARTDGTA
jgi:1-hydroxycarotenoid 3,4-desaturase